MNVVLRWVSVVFLSAMALAFAQVRSEGAVIDADDTTAVKPADLRTLHLPEPPYHFADLALPPHFKTAAARRLDNTPANNPVTDNGATLGRVLFYDTKVSANNTKACA